MNRITSRPGARRLPLAPILLALWAGCTGMVGEAPATPPAVHDVPDGLPRAGTPRAEAPPAARPAPAPLASRICAPRPARIWKLTPDQLGRTVHHGGTGNHLFVLGLGTLGGYFKTPNVIQYARDAKTPLDGPARGLGEVFVSISNAMGVDIGVFGLASHCLGPMPGLRV